MTCVICTLVLEHGRYSLCYILVDSVFLEEIEDSHGDAIEVQYIIRVAFVILVQFFVCETTNKVENYCFFREKEKKSKWGMERELSPDFVKKFI